MKVLEFWKPIKEYKELYEVSNLGRVRGIKRKGSNGCVLSPAVRKDGYLQVSLRKEGSAKAKLVHRLVAEAFIPNENNKSQVNHIDGDRTNNIISNLEWVTAKENCLHAHDCLKKNTKSVMCIETGIVYPSIRSASRSTGVDNTDISRICRGVGNVKTTKGLTWRYV